jgi:hypothetical protein
MCCKNVEQRDIAVTGAEHLQLEVITVHNSPSLRELTMALPEPCDAGKVESGLVPQ